jgi:hypothetical protein
MHETAWTALQATQIPVTPGDAKARPCFVGSKGRIFPSRVRADGRTVLEFEADFCNSVAPGVTQNFLNTLRYLALSGGVKLAACWNVTPCSLVSRSAS